MIHRFGALLRLEDSILVVSTKNSVNVANFSLTDRIHGVLNLKTNQSTRNSSTRKCFKIKKKFRKFLQHISKTEDFFINSEINSNGIKDLRDEIPHFLFVGKKTFTLSTFVRKGDKIPLVLPKGKMDEIDFVDSRSNKNTVGSFQRRKGSNSIQAEKNAAKREFLEETGLEVELSTTKYILINHKDREEFLRVDTANEETDSNFDEKMRNYLEKPVSVTHFYLVKRVLSDLGPQEGRLRGFVRKEDVLKL